MGKLLFCKFDKLTSVRIQNTEKEFVVYDSPVKNLGNKLAAQVLEI